MTKIDMINKIVTEMTGYARKDVEAVLAAYENFVKDTLAADKDEKIPLPGLGAFSVKTVPERSGVSTLGDKKEWTKPAHDEICFKLIKSIKEI